jgi:hypothetical protein
MSIPVTSGAGVNTAKRQKIEALAANYPIADEVKQAAPE